MNRRIFALLALTITLWGPGCSDDDEKTNNTNNSTTKLDASVDTGFDLEVATTDQGESDDMGVTEVASDPPPRSCDAICEQQTRECTIAGDSVFDDIVGRAKYQGGSAIILRECDTVPPVEVGSAIGLAPLEQIICFCK